MVFSFDLHGNPSPYGILTVDMVKFQQIFATIPDVSARAKLLTRFQAYIDDFDNEISPSDWAQWIGGSYVTQKPIPNDIDVVNFIDPTSCEAAGNLLYSFVTDNNVKSDSKNKYSIDGYLVPLFDDTDPRHHITLNYTNYWQNWLGRDRNNNPKAIIEVIHK